jgi:hypothetical protein
MSKAKPVPHDQFIVVTHSGDFVSEGASIDHALEGIDSDYIDRKDMTLYERKGNLKPRHGWEVEDG